MYRPVPRHARRSLRPIYAALAAMLLVALLPPARAQNAAGPPTTTSDDRLLAVAREVPGFGGAFVKGDATVGEAERLFIWLVDRQPDRGQQAREALKRHLGSRFDQPVLEVLRADFDFAQLKTWHQEMNAAFGLPGVVLTDVDETRNRLLIGVEDPEAQSPAVRTLASERGVPHQALEFVRATSFKRLLRSERRPMRGGLQIQFQKGFLGLDTKQCTLGLPAVRNGVSGFVTNSHCSRTQGEVDNGRYWQPGRTALDTNQVGTETVDPAFSTGAGCFDGFRCRLSDTNFVSAQNANHIVPGRIARIPTNTLTWNGTSLWRVTSSHVPELDMVVSKVGRTTGLTSGRITNTCANIQQEGSDLVITCDVLSDMWVDAGDSGSPTFRPTNVPLVDDVAVLGFVWGGGTIDGVDTSVFSDIDDVRQEIGPLQVCAAGFSC